MRIRLLKCGLALAALLLLGFFAPSLYWQVLGRCRGEAFYAGRPTSFWRGSIETEVRRSSRFVRALLKSGPVTWHDKLADWKDRWLGFSSPSEQLRDPAAVSVLRELLRDENAKVCRTAFDIAIQDSDRAKGLMSELVDCLVTNPNLGWQRLRDCARTWEVFNGDAAPFLMRYAEGLDKKLSLEATMSLIMLDATEEEVLAKSLASQRDDDKLALLTTMIGLLVPGPKAITALRTAAKSEDARVRRYAAKALGQRRDSPDERITILRDLMADADASVRAMAATILLEDLMELGDASVRATAAAVLNETRRGN